MTDANFLHVMHRWIASSTLLLTVESCQPRMYPPLRTGNAHPMVKMELLYRSHAEQTLHSSYIESASMVSTRTDLSQEPTAHADQGSRLDIVHRAQVYQRLFSCRNIVPPRISNGASETQRTTKQQGEGTLTDVTPALANGGLPRQVK